MKRLGSSVSKVVTHKVMMAMVEITVNVTGQCVAPQVRGELVAGMVGVPVTFTFDSQWDGLEITAVFRNTGTARDVALDNSGRTTVPWEVLQQAYTKLEVGVEGRRMDGTVVIPTTWAVVADVLPGARVSGNPAAEPTPTQYDRLLGEIRRVEDSVPGWAKEPEKPRYTAQEVGALSQDDLQGAVDTVLQQVKNSAPAIICGSAGTVIQVHDSTELLLRGLTLYGKTIQDGTPAPENPVELVSAGDSGAINAVVAGKNWIDPQSITTNGNTNIYVWRDTGKLLPAGTYTMQYVKPTDRNISGIYVRSYASPETIAVAYGQNVLTFTLAEDTRVHLDFYKDGGLPSLEADSVMLERGATATPYEPYKERQTISGHTPTGLPGIPVTSGGNYTDENGQQWICDEVDFGRGMYVKRIKRATIAKMNFEHLGSFFCCVTGDKKPGTLNLRCSHYPIEDIPPNIGDKFSRGEDNTDNIYVRDIDYTDAEAFKSALGDAVFLYELAEPIETALTNEELEQYAALHSNKPNTTVYNDAGTGMGVEYVADTKLYIDQKLAAISAAVLNG